MIEIEKHAKKLRLPKMSKAQEDQVLEVLTVFAEWAERGAKSYQDVKKSERPEWVCHQIDYWETVQASFLWAGGFILSQRRTKRVG